MLIEAQHFLAWTGVHPIWALGLLFLVAMLDALFIIGLFVPAAIVLFGMGALVALGSLELWSTVVVAAAGALSGDALSFIFGRVLGDRLFEVRLLQRYPEMIAGGRRFFARHGGKSVLLARFLGPMRAVTPAVAGASGMPTWLFLLADGVGSLIWALVYVVPGMVFGASLALAAEVAVRLAALLVVGFLAVVLGIWLTRIVMGVFQSHAEQWLGTLMDWSRRHRGLGRFGAALADPDQPETPALAGAAFLLLLFGAGWLLLWDGGGGRAYPGTLDAMVYQTFQGLRTPWGTLLATALSRLGEWLVYGPVAAAVFAALLWRQRLRAAAHWIAALGFGALLWQGLAAVPILAAPNAFFGGGSHVVRDLIMPTIIYGFTAVLFATQRPVPVRNLAYGIASSLILLIVLARLYLGQEWWSLSAFSVVVGLLWVGALGLGYRRHAPERLFAKTFALPVLAIFVLVVSLRWGADSARHEAAPPEVAQSMTSAEWWSGGWAHLPATRTDMRGRRGNAFDLQWVGRIEDIEAALRAAGWLPTPEVSAVNALRWLTETSSIAELPVLPLVHAGRHPRLSLRLPGSDEHQRLIRLWASGWQLRDAGDEADRPVWLGIVSEQQARTYYRLFRYPVAELDAPSLPPLSQSTASLRVQKAEAGTRALWLLGPRPQNFTLPFNDAPPQAPVPLTTEK